MYFSLRVTPLLLLPGCLLFSPAAGAAFLDAGDLSVTAVLDGPPAADSGALQKDEATVEGWQSKRKSEDCARATREAHVKFGALFGAPDGPLTLAEVSRLSPLFTEITEDADAFAAVAKNHWRRTRPYLAQKGVKLCPGLEQTKSSFSFPSGHATAARLFALVLGEIDPARREIFLTRAHQIAEDRVLAGFHYPSDVEAGKKLGDSIFRVLQKKIRFQKKLAALKP